jgi:AcrR family transcriptional regulator
MAEDTQPKLIAATETLLGEKGHAGVTLRDITELAGTNVASVAYHFGSKDELVAKVYRDALAEVTNAQRQSIESLPREASIRDVVAMWLSPALDPASTSTRQQNLWALIRRGALEQAPGLASAAEGLVTHDNPLFTRLSELLPHVPQPLLRMRHDLVLGGVSALFGASLQSSSRGIAPSSPNPSDIIDWVVGGLAAELTPVAKPQL